MKRVSLVLAAVLVVVCVQVASAAIRGTGGGSRSSPRYSSRSTPPYTPHYAPSYGDPGLYGAEHAYKSIPSWYGSPYYPYRTNPYYVVPKRR